MAYATVAEVEAGFRTLSENEQAVCTALLDEAAVLIDAVAISAAEINKRIVSCRMIRRALGAGEDASVPLGASQGTISAGGYSQNWTLASGGSTGELYLGKTDKQLLGIGNKLGASNPYMEETTCEG